MIYLQLTNTLACRFRQFQCRQTRNRKLQRKSKTSCMTGKCERCDHYLIGLEPDYWILRDLQNKCRQMPASAQIRAFLSCVGNCSCYFLHSQGIMELSVGFICQIFFILDEQNILWTHFSKIAPLIMQQHAKKIFHFRNTPQFLYYYNERRSFQ